MQLLDRAIEFATKAHEGQKRKYTNEPYINHCLNVMNILKELEFPMQMLCAAILHDTVEDTEVTKEEIESIFGFMISNMVDDLTEKYTSKAFPHLNRKERKALECTRLAKTDYPSKCIKLADLIDNTSSIVERDPSFAKVYLEEKHNLLTNALWNGDQRLYNRAMKIYQESIKILKQ